MVFPQPILQCVVEKPRYTAACEGVYKKLSTLCTRLSPDTLWKVLWIKWIASLSTGFYSGILRSRNESQNLAWWFAVPTAVGTRVDTKVSTLVNPVSFIPNLAKIGERRPLRKGERQRIYSSAWTRVARHVSAYSQGRIPCCYTYGFIYAGATQGELPEGQERVPWGITVLRNPLARYNARQL